MNKTYLINSKNETVDQYLTKAARWIDIIRNDAVYPEDECIEITNMKEEEKREIINYVFSIMYPLIVKTVNGCAGSLKLNDMRDEFMNRLAMDVFVNMHKFNNPRYASLENENFMFTTFVKQFVMNAACVVWREKRGLTKREDDKRRAVQKASKLAVEFYEKDEDTLSTDEIHNFIEQVSVLKLSKKDIGNILVYMKGNLSLDVLSRDMHPVIETEMITYLDPKIEEEIRKFLVSMRPVERFVFLQQFEYCSDYYANMTREELIAESYFVELCEKDKYGSRHIVLREDNQSKMVECSFLKNVREASKKRFSKMIHSIDCSYDDLKGKIEEIMLEQWNEFQID